MRRADTIEGNPSRWLLKMGSFMLANVKTLPVDNGLFAGLIDSRGGGGLLNVDISGGNIIYDWVGVKASGACEHPSPYYANPE